MYNQYIILSDPKQGREAEFHDWYHYVHMREVMEQRVAAIAAQCFHRVGDLVPDRFGYRQKFLCLYENSDPEAMTGAAGGTVASHAHMLMSSAGDREVRLGGGYYDTVAQHVIHAGSEKAVLAVEWIEADGPAIGDYVASRLAGRLKHSGVFSAWLGKASEHQLYAVPKPGHVAIYHVASAERATAIWNEVATEPSSSIVSAACYAPIFERVTRMQVLAPDEATQAEITRARAAVR